jgi:hypothetical protein
MADDATSSSPATGASPTAVPSDPAELTPEQLRDEIWSLSPQEADAVLNEYAASFHQQAPLVPTTPREAAQRLQQLAQTPGYLAKLESGHWETVQEWRRLCALQSEATIFDPAEIGDFSGASELGLPALSRRNQISAAADLYAEGCSDEEVAFILSDKKYPQADVDAAAFWLPRLEANPDLQYPDELALVDRAGFMKFLRRIIIIGSGS